MFAGCCKGLTTLFGPPCSPSGAPGVPGGTRYPLFSGSALRPPSRAAPPLGAGTAASVGTYKPEPAQAHKVITARPGCPAASALRLWRSKLPVRVPGGTCVLPADAGTQLLALSFSGAPTPHGGARRSFPEHAIRSHVFGPPPPGQAAKPLGGRSGNHDELRYSFSQVRPRAAPPTASSRPALRSSLTRGVGYDLICPGARPPCPPFGPPTPPRGRPGHSEEWRKRDQLFARSGSGAPAPLNL